MPTPKDREKILRELDTAILSTVLGNLLNESSGSSDSSSDESSDGDLEMLLNLEETVRSRRYLRPRDTVVKSDSFVCHLLPNLDDGRFRSEMRVTQAAFAQILNLVSENEGAAKVFRNDSASPYSTSVQKPVEFQLAVALFRFGHYGNGVSTGRVARTFGISEGAVDLYTNRVMTALMALLPNVLRWPSEEEKAAIKSRVFAAHQFPGCVGFVDGTLLVLDKRPSLNGENYFSRKKLYGMSAMVVSDDRRKIIYAFTGFPGSAHDSRAYLHSEIGTKPTTFFSGDEYLISDSGYSTTRYVVAAYKAPATDLRENSDFNTYLAEARVVNEHTIGVLKGRFQSLRGLRINIKDKKTHGRVVAWFLSCCVLHNILCDMRDEPVDDSWNEIPAEDHEPPAFEQNIGRLDEGKRKREQIKTSVLLNKNSTI